MNSSGHIASSAAPDFSLAFQQMASVVAIAKTRNIPEILAELVKQCFAILPDEPLRSPEDVASAVRTLFGIQLSTQDVKTTIENLLAKGELLRLAGDHLGLPPELQELLHGRIEAARDLQEAVKQSWLSQVKTAYPELDPDGLWRVLSGYLAQSFRRHGIQAVTLLDPAAQIAEQQVGSLSAMLNDECRKEFGQAKVTGAREAVSQFFSTVGSDRRRAEYITQVADAAFNYFSITVAPDIAERLRAGLSPLVLFLDTNFLFGILDLDSHSQVEVSQELVQAIGKYHFPFSLRYHQATTREMNTALQYYADELRKQPWPQAISRAASRSPRFSGMELRYHNANSQRPLAVEDFLSPYRHWDVLVKAKGIDVYNPTASEAALRERADLEAEYREFLIFNGRDKTQDVIQHDMSALQTVRSLQNRARSSLDAGALLVTCDNMLFRFDLERSRRGRTHCCVVLPSLFWQLLRPFVPNGEDFDEAFAETFALPEFSLARGGAAKAASRMLGILASYGSVPEETAVRMLANDMLLDELQTKTSDAEYSTIINAELARVNEELAEEVAAAAAESRAERQRREVAEGQLAHAQEALALIDSEMSKKDRALEEQQKALAQKDRALLELGEVASTSEQQAREAAIEAVNELKKKEDAEKSYKEMQDQKARAEQLALRSKITGGIIVGILLAALFELVVNTVLPWRWLLSHQQSYGLQGCIVVIIVTTVVGLWVKQWRKVLWVTFAGGVFFVLLPLLGGPPASP